MGGSRRGFFFPRPFALFGRLFDRVRSPPARVPPASTLAARRDGCGLIRYDRLRRRSELPSDRRGAAGPAARAQAFETKKGRAAASPLFTGAGAA